MSSTSRGERDLTAAARIRDAAIGYIGRHGFARATVRAIAAEAAVSPGLVIHHFGSKDGLLAACREHVTAQITALTEDFATDAGPGNMLTQLGRRDEVAPLAGYLVQVFRRGGEFAQQLYERVVSDTEAWLRAGVVDGSIKPTGDERLRAEMLTAFSLGIQTLADYALPGISDPAERINRAGYRYTEPALELFSHGLFTTTEYLDAYRAATAQRPAQKGTKP